ncbi:hypothetical protein O9G_000590 [Rozella allomycis CSF55]|uniref:Uncharacterized protein n=1 Tax=Rozella allomycis (strain CSF55) TaxID=988480 RepID=A0A075AVQ0_ROZAC|nr:hypothetical protein O9G_000590 [Rozella allomycis CSF55]|eukprot:EPZ34403.1 hypothetical protein O9G_000590 [Rozella allomycis CSF55]
MKAFKNSESEKNNFNPHDKFLFDAPMFCDFTTEKFQLGKQLLEQYLYCHDADQFSISEELSQILNGTDHESENDDWFQNLHPRHDNLQPAQSPESNNVTPSRKFKPLKSKLDHTKDMNSTPILNKKATDKIKIEDLNSVHGIMSPLLNAWKKNKSERNRKSDENEDKSKITSRNRITNDKITETDFNSLQDLIDPVSRNELSNLKMLDTHNYKPKAQNYTNQNTRKPVLNPILQERRDARKIQASTDEIKKMISEHNARIRTLVLDYGHSVQHQHLDLGLIL